MDKTCLRPRQNFSENWWTEILIDRHPSSLGWYNYLHSYQLNSLWFNIIKILALTEYCEQELAIGFCPRVGQKKGKGFLPSGTC